MSSAAGSYSSSLDFTPTFGDGGSDGDGNGTYTITVEVNDGVNAAVTQDLILTVNDVDQDVSATGTTRIEAESYDNQGNTGGPAVDGIGVENAGPTGFLVGFTTDGDFVEYEINVQTAGTYQMDFSVARQPSGSRTMTITSTAGSASLEVNDTGTWSDYTTVSATIPLAAGSQTLRFDWDDGAGTGFYFNTDYFDLTLQATQDPVFTLSLTDQTNDEEIPLQVYK